LTNERQSVERRRDRRHPFRVQLVLSRGGQEVAAQTEDVSFAGVFIRMDTPLPVRQLVRLKLTLPPEGDALAVMGLVARHFPARDGLPPGVGIQFYSLATEERRRWNHFIRFVVSSTEVTSPILLAPTPATPHFEPGELFGPAEPVEPIRRSFPRYAATLQVRLDSLDDLEMLYTRNVSKGGLFFGTTHDLPEGTRLKVSLIHPRTHEHFPLEATVRWRDTSAQPGLGLEFVQFSDQRREEFFEFIRSEIPVEEVVYVSVGDPHLTHFTPLA
jgi:Tfp pilus assembly protein PilZ